MGKDMARQVTIDPDAWARNLRVAPDAPTDDDACMRWLNNYFAFWVICETKACKRSSRCAGDAKACHDRTWPHVPERMKFEFRATLKAIKNGIPPDAVKQQIDEEMTRFDETARVLERLGYAASCSSPRPAKRGEGGERSEPGEGKVKGPRVRML